MQHYLVPATLFARRARNIRNSATRINNKRKYLRRSPDPKPRRVVPEIIQFFNYRVLPNKNKNEEEGVRETTT